MNTTSILCREVEDETKCMKSQVHIEEGRKNGRLDLDEETTKTQCSSVVAQLLAE